MNKLTPRVLILAASIAGLIACDSAKQVQQETQDLNATKQEVAKDQAELRQEQRQEQAELRTDENRAVARDPALRPVDGTGAVEPGVNARAENRMQDRAEDRADLAKDQAEERADLNQKATDKIRDKQEDLAEAKQDANEERGDLLKDSRDKLRKIDERAAELRTKVSSATAEDKAQVTTALSSFPTKRQALERDIEALSSVKEANLSRAKDKVEKQFSSLDKTLDKAESSL